MPKPAHIPDDAWAKALELIVTAPAMWTRDICAGTFIDTDGEVTEVDDDYCDNDYNNDYNEYDEDYPEIGGDDDDDE